MSLKYRTPVSGSLRRSRSKSGLYTAASPNKRFLSDGPCFSAANVVISTQSSIASSNANHEVRPSNPGGIFGVDWVWDVTVSVANVYSSSSIVSFDYLF